MVYLLNRNFGLTSIGYEIKVNNLAPQGVLQLRTFGNCFFREAGRVQSKLPQERSGWVRLSERSLSLKRPVSRQIVLWMPRLGRFAEPYGFRSRQRLRVPKSPKKKPWYTPLRMDVPRRSSLVFRYSHCPRTTCPPQ